MIPPFPLFKDLTRSSKHSTCKTLIYTSTRILLTYNFLFDREPVFSMTSEKPSFDSTFISNTEVPGQFQIRISGAVRKVS